MKIKINDNLVIAGTPEEMDDLISRQAAKLAIVEKGQASKRYKVGEFWELNRNEIWDALDGVPSAQPKRKTGKWIHDGFNHPHGVDWCHCSICGNRDSVDSVYTQVDMYPYCAKCGAKMNPPEGGEDG